MRHKTGRRSSPETTTEAVQVVSGVTAAVSSSRPLEQGIQAMHGATLQRTVTITNPHGFHVRPATAFVEAARQFQCQVTLIKGDQRVDGRRPFELLLLDAGPGTELVLEVQGADATEALERLTAILSAPEPPEPPLPKKG